MSDCRITWDGPCDRVGLWHACVREGEHYGRHKCVCGARSLKHIRKRTKPPLERPEPIFMRVPRKERPYTKREPSFYWPKYLKRKRGLM